MLTLYDMDRMTEQLASSSPQPTARVKRCHVARLTRLDPRGRVPPNRKFNLETMATSNILV